MSVSPLRMETSLGASSEPEFDGESEACLNRGPNYPSSINQAVSRHVSLEEAQHENGALSCLLHVRSEDQSSVIGNTQHEGSDANQPAYISNIQPSLNRMDYSDMLEPRRWVEMVGHAEPISRSTNITGRWSSPSEKVQLTRAHDNVEILVTKTSPFMPIQQLPTEILQEIFVHCTPDDFFYASPHSAPLSLSSTCRSWRSIAISTPYLWSSISITVTDDTLHQGTLFFANLWIRRSILSPLSFRITEIEGHNRIATLPVSVISTVLNLFVPHHARWRNVQLRFRGSWRQQTGLSFLPKDATFPWLEHIFIERKYWIEQQDMQHINNMTTHAPRLQGVSWVSQKPYSSLNIPWSQLTRFTLGHVINLKEGLEVIANTPRLVHVSLTLMLPFSSPSIDGFDSLHISHDHLESLQLHAAGNPGVLFDRLTLPGLKALRLNPFAPPRSEQSRIYWDQPHFMSMLNRSGCALQKLSFQEIDLLPDQVLEILRSSSSLRQLELRNFKRRKYVNDEVLQALDCSIKSTSQEVLCPLLTSIRFRGCISSTDGVLAKMVKSRLPEENRWDVSCLVMAHLGVNFNATHWLDFILLKNLIGRGITISTLHDDLDRS